MSTCLPLVVVEFPQAVCFSDGRSSGTRRGWFPATEPGLAELLRGNTLVVAWVASVTDAQLLVAASSGEGHLE